MPDNTPLCMKTHFVCLRLSEVAVDKKSEKKMHLIQRHLFDLRKQKVNGIKPPWKNVIYYRRFDKRRSVWRFVNCQLKLLSHYTTSGYFFDWRCWLCKTANSKTLLFEAKWHNWFNFSFFNRNFLNPSSIQSIACFTLVAYNNLDTIWLAHNVNVFLQA